MDVCFEIISRTRQNVDKSVRKELGSPSSEIVRAVHGAKNEPVL